MAYEAGRVSAALFGLSETATAPLVTQPAAFVFKPIEAATTEVESDVPKEKKRKATGSGDKDKESKKAKVEAAQPVKKARDPEEVKRTIIVKNVPVAETSKSLRKALGLTNELVESIRFRNLPVPQKFSNNKGLAKILKSYKTEDATQTAFVVLKSAEYIDDTLVRNRELKIDGRSILVDRVCPEDKFSKFDKIRTVFVGRLSMKHDEDFLLEEFSQVGKVQNVRVVRDPKTSESKKFGFVCFEQKAAVPQAVATYAKKQIDNRTLRVTKVMKEDEAKAVLERKALKGRHSTAPQKTHAPMNKLSKNKKRQMKHDASKQGAARRVSKKGALAKKSKSKPRRS